VLLLALAALWQINFNDGVDLEQPPIPVTDAQAQLQRGAYLARVGNCLACHTARGGATGAGGRPIATDFGTVFTSNLTPDPAHGIGRWSAAAFWRALHHGRAADGRLLVPVFPYTHTTLLTRADSDALYAWFRQLPPAPRPPRPTRCAGPTARRPRWRCGARCTSGPAAGSPSRRRTRAGTGAPTWCAAWRTARPATPRATRWAAPTGARCAAACWAGRAGTRPRCTTRARPAWPTGQRPTSPACCKPASPNTAAPARPWPRWCGTAPST
jgi:hypothetical protein